MVSSFGLEHVPHMHPRREPGPSSLDTHTHSGHHFGCKSTRWVECVPDWRLFVRLDWTGCCAHAVIVVPVSLPLMQAIGSLTRPCATFHLGLLPLEDVAVKTLGRLLFLASRTYCPFYPTPLAASWPPVHAHSAPTGLATLLSLSCCRELSSYPYPVSLPPSLAYACLHNTPHPHLIHLAFVSQDTSPRLHSRLGLHMVLESRCSARKSRQGPSHLHLHFTPSTSHPRIIAHGLDGHLHSSWLAFALFRVAIIP